MKIHYSHLSESVTGTLIRERNALRPRVRITPHAQDRMHEKHISIDEVKAALRDSTLIEVRRETHLCVLWRGLSGVCVVLDHDTGWVVTAFRNGPWDQHKTLDRKLYYWGPYKEGDLTKRTQVWP